MMSPGNKKCIYNKNHVLTIIDKNQGQIFERNLNLNINNCDESLEIKIRDPTEYNFNYSLSITSAVYDVMRINQNLDINYIEFKTNLLEMLQQFQNKEMYLKCEVSADICSLIFYGRSKIKSLVFLILDLLVTNQKEILSELIGHMQEIQGFNEKLKKQVSFLKSASNEKDQQIKHMEFLRNHLEIQFLDNLKKLENVFNTKFEEIQNLVKQKLFAVKQRVLKLLNDVEILKINFLSKSEANKNMCRLMENMRLESTDNATLINNLKIENSALSAERMNYEKCIDDLRRILKEKELQNNELQRKNEELHDDLKKATIIITQKKSTIEELSQDLVQANQMLVNFNKHYDEKVKQIENLEMMLKLKEDAIVEEQNKFQSISNEFEKYKQIFNHNNQEKIAQELSLATNKIIELEKTMRKVNKINTLLTDKVNEFGFPLQRKS